MTLTADAETQAAVTAGDAPTGRAALGNARAAGSAGRHRRALPVGARLVGLGQRLLRRRGAGRHAGPEGVAVRVARRRQRHHRRQAARRAVGNGAVRQAVRLQRVHDAVAAGADGRRRGRPAVRRGAAGQRRRRRPDRRCGAGADAGGGADVPVQQPRRAAGSADGGRRVLRGARDRDRAAPSGWRWPVVRSASPS